MKHTFSAWVTDDAGDAHSHCKRCGVKVRIAHRQSTTKFLVDGRWTAKRPTCTTKPETTTEGEA